ncbi:molybdenum cofactor biosynthesis protein MoaE [Brevundimonas sp. Marseille-Q4549]
MARLDLQPLDAAALLAEFSRGRTTTGAVVSFSGLARDRTDGLDVRRLTLDAFPGFTEKVMAEMEAETRARFDVQDVLAIHRWGPIETGEVIVFVAVAAEHRRAAFLAADYLMDQLKTRAPLWKKEDGPDGSRWIAPRPQDYQDAERWTAPKG